MGIQGRLLSQGKAQAIGRGLAEVVERPRAEVGSTEVVAGPRFIHWASTYKVPV